VLRRLHQRHSKQCRLLRQALSRERYLDWSPWHMLRRALPEVRMVYMATDWDVPERVVMWASLRIRAVGLRFGISFNKVKRTAPPIYPVAPKTKIEGIVSRFVVGLEMERLYRPFMCNYLRQTAQALRKLYRESRGCIIGVIQNVLDDSAIFGESTLL